MQKRVKETIEQYAMFQQGAHIIIGLSGGMDSVTLLHLLHSWQAAAGWRLSAVHIHHGLRGADADEDARFVQQLCADLDIPCILRRYDVRAEARARGLGEEETGRLLRYAAFAEIAGADGRIAVAHHQNDQAETLLMRLCRGTGLKGLTGMAPVRENICRPLLYCSRQELLDYCRERGLRWREDGSNQQEDYTRNKLRLRVLPLLEQVNPRAVAHIAKTAELLTQEEDYLHQQTQAAYAACLLAAQAEEVRLDRNRLCALHPALRRRVLRRAMEVFSQRDVSVAQIEAMEELLGKQTGRRRNLSGGICAENQYEALVLSLPKERESRGFCYALPQEGTLFVPEAECTLITRCSQKMEKIPQDACTNVFDYDKINQTVFFRTRRAGDFLSIPAGRKKLKRLFIDWKLPREERERLPLLALGQEVLWIPFLRKGTAYAPDEQTKNYWYIRIRRSQE